MHTNLVAAAGQAPARAGELVNVAVIVLDRRSLCGDEITGAAVAMQLALTAEERTVLGGRRRTCFIGARAALINTKYPPVPPEHARRRGPRKAPRAKLP